MNTTTFGPLRCKLPRKPWIHNASLRFWHCAACARLLHEYLPDHPAEQSAATETTKPPQSPPLCCGTVMEQLPTVSAGEAAPELGIDYDIMGGFNNNAVKVQWNRAASPRPVWVALQTYSGVYLKHVPVAKKPPLVFPLSDEDAYTYCDREVCEKCLYCCKKGCTLYLYMGEKIVVAMPLDNIAAYFQNKSL